MKKVLFVFFIFLFLVTPITAQTEKTTHSDFSFYFEVTSSYKNQIFYDYLFESPDKLNSRLDYKADYIFSEGIAGGIILNNYECYLSTQFSLPFKCGKMYDSDWRTEGIKTNYSISDLYIDFGFDSMLLFKYNFDIGQKQNRFLVSPVISISYSYIRYNAKNTIGWCGDIAHTGLTQNYPWDSEYATKWRKYGIDLTNNITNIFLGFEIQKYIKSFNIKAGFLVSPFTYIFSVDHHLNSGEGNYYQMIQKSYFSVLDFYFTSSFSINKNNSIILGFDYSFCPRVDGEFYTGYYKTECYLDSEISSFKYNIVSSSISWRITFEN